MPQLAFLTGSLALLAATAQAADFVPVLKDDAVSVYVCRPAKAWFASMPPANAPTVRIAGASGPLPWATCLQASVPPGEVELVAEPGQGGWAFGRFGLRVEAVAGSARVFVLEITEVMPEDKGMAVQRNWVARFREIGFAEAGPGLRKVYPAEPASRP